MATSVNPMEEELYCPVCCEMYRDPVVLKCSHSFCRACLQLSWKQKSSRECLLCRRRSSVEKPPANLALRNVVESYLKQRNKTESIPKDELKNALHCSKHGEKLLLFCEDDQEPICVVCQTSKTHRNHLVCPADEAAQDIKDEFKSKLKPIKEKLETFCKVKQECEKTVKHIKSQSQFTEQHIKEEFKKLHQFLSNEEEARLAALREEEEQKSQRMNKNIENISQLISTLSDKIRDIEKIIVADDISFLKMHKHIRKRAQVTLQDPEPVLEALIDVAKHLGSLKFRVWEKMLGIAQYTPVTLDPNTSRSSLCVSNDLTSVKHTGHYQQLPDNPERFSLYALVLGSEGFRSGKHSWEVEVGDKTSWIIGVAKTSTDRKNKINLCPENGFWTVILKDGDEYTAATTPWTHITLERKPQRIRVQLNYDDGEVSFYNPSDKSHIYTFKHTFTETLYPCFCPGVNTDGNNPGDLKICPVKASVMMK